MTGRSQGGGGLTFDVNRGVTIRPEDVTVEGPGPVRVRSDMTGTTETVTRGNRTYTGAVRFEVPVAGSYRIVVAGEPSASGEVLLARPLSDAFSKWRWFLVFVLGMVVALVGMVAGLIGAGNRRAARLA